MGTRRQAGIRGLLATAVVGAGAGFADGQVIRPDSLPDTRIPIEEMVRRLDAEVFAAREQATLDLFRRSDLTLAWAESRLEEPGLTAEQRLRLEQVALAAFARGPWAAVGIQFAPSDAGGQRITDTVQGFDAARVLQPGDVVLSADGQPVFSQRSFKAAILSRDPGGTMRMEILRGGERAEVEFELGSYSQLRSPMSPQPGDLLAAWSLRRSRVSGGVPAGVIIPTLDAESMPEIWPGRGSAAWDEAFASPDAPSGLVIGGQSREGVDLSLKQLTSAEASRRDAIMGPSGDPMGQRAVLRQERDSMLAQIASAQRYIQVHNLDDLQRAQVQLRLVELADRLREIDDQLRALDEIIPERPKP